MVALKSDHIRARHEVLGVILIGGTPPKPDTDPLSIARLITMISGSGMGLEYSI